MDKLNVHVHYIDGEREDHEGVRAIDSNSPTIAVFVTDDDETRIVINLAATKKLVITSCED